MQQDYIHPSASDYLTIIKITLLSIMLVAASLWLQGDIGLNLSDEGYLWYGQMETALGRVPIRDYQSYDPGRYYWAAFWSLLFGDGIMALRLSTAIFQAIGLTFGLLAASRAVKSYPVLIFTGIMLVIWMYPRHKLFDISLSMASVFFALRLLERPSLMRHFAAGVFVGIAAFIGRNHGLYGLLTFSSLTFFIWLKMNRTALVRRSFVFTAGILVGSLPLIIMLLSIPGFPESFRNQVVTTSFLYLPIPWPWSLDYSHLSLTNAISGFLTGTIFILMPVFYLYSIIKAFFSSTEDLKNKSLLIAASFTGIFYMHHAFSRADFGHLTQTMQPLLLVAVSLPMAFGFSSKKTLTVALACLAVFFTFFTAAMASPYYLRQSAPAGWYVRYDIKGDNLLLPRETASMIESVKNAVAGNIQPGEGLIIAPHLTTMYCILGRRSPAWEIYNMFPAKEERQVGTIERLKQENVRWALLGDVALDGRDELRFQNTHRLIYQYLTEGFEEINAPGLPDNYRMLHQTNRPGRIQQGHDARAQ